MSWKHLDGRFLSKAEEVSPGEMMEFPGHLVERGNSEANDESLRDLNACGNSFNSLQKLICKSSSIMLLMLNLL